MRKGLISHVLGVVTKVYTNFKAIIFTKIYKQKFKEEVKPVLFVYN